MWRLRRGLWNLIARFKFSSNRPAVIPVPRDEKRKIKPVSFVSQFPRIPVPNILVADHVPSDEASPGKYYFYEIQVALYRLFSPMQRGLPPIDPDPETALDNAYPEAHEKLFRRPVMPDEYKNV